MMELDTLKMPYTPKRKTPLLEVLTLVAIIVAALASYALSSRVQRVDGKLATGSDIRPFAKQIDGIAVHQQGEVFTLIPRDGGGYGIQEDSAMLLKEEDASEVFSVISALRLTPVQEVAAQEAYGFTASGAQVEIVSEGKTQNLTLGNVIPSGRGRYVLWENKVYTASAFVQGLPTIADLHAVPALWTSGGMPNEISIESKNRERIVAGINNQPSVGVTSIYLFAPFKWEMDIEQAASLINAIENMKLSSWEMKKTQENLTNTGLDDPTTVSAVYETENGKMSWTLHIGNTMNDTMRYVTLDGDNNIFSMAAESLSFFLDAKATALMNRFAGLVSLQYVQTLTVVWDAEKPLVMRCEIQGETESYFVEDRLMETGAFKELYRNILSPQVDGVLPIDWKLDKAETPRLSLVFALNNGSEERVAYYPYDHTYDALERNGTFLFYVAREKTDEVIKQLSAARPSL